MLLPSGMPPTLTLNNGYYLPAIGIGCWMGTPGADAHNMVVSALKMGYRHIDTASNYGNEETVGRGIRESGVSREDIFLTTKLDSRDHGRVSEALEESLERLGVEYIDLYLIHWPLAMTEEGKTLQPDESPTVIETWQAMEQLIDSGRVRSIGVSNFSEKTLGPLLEKARIVPAVNQVESHPCLPQHALLAFCRSRGIILTAYSPVGKNKFTSDPDILRIAEAHNSASGAQVLLSWGVQRGTAVIPKSMNEIRMIENITLLLLTPEEMEVLDMLHDKQGMHRSVCGFHSPDLGGSCFGWTYEQLGWDMISGGVVQQ